MCILRILLHIEKTGEEIWEVQDILHPWESWSEKIIHFASKKMGKTCIFQLKIQKRFIV